MTPEELKNLLLTTTKPENVLFDQTEADRNSYYDSFKRFLKSIKCKHPSDIPSLQSKMRNMKWKSGTCYICKCGKSYKSSASVRYHFLSLKCQAMTFKSLVSDFECTGYDLITMHLENDLGWSYHKAVEYLDANPGKESKTPSRSNSRKSDAFSLTVEQEKLIRLTVDAENVLFEIDKKSVKVLEKKVIEFLGDLGFELDSKTDFAVLKGTNYAKLAKSFQCGCGKSYATGGGLYYHITTFKKCTERKTKCLITGKSFDSIAEVETHLRIFL